MENYEGIRQRIKKIYALAKSGVEGEADSARRRLNEMLQKYSLSLDDIIGDDQRKEKHIFKFQKSYHLDLLVQCYAAVTGNETMSFLRHKRRVLIELTAIENAELEAMYNFYRRHMDREIEKIVKNAKTAFFVKHALALKLIVNRATSHYLRKKSAN